MVFSFSFYMGIYYCQHWSHLISSLTFSYPSFLILCYLTGVFILPCHAFVWTRVEYFIILYQKFYYQLPYSIFLHGVSPFLSYCIIFYVVQSFISLISLYFLLFSIFYRWISPSLCSSYLGKKEDTITWQIWTTCQLFIHLVSKIDQEMQFYIQFNYKIHISKQKISWYFDSSMT